jgi:dihydrofolate synthase/folylpolyglutamate synthase
MIERMSYDACLKTMFGLRRFGIKLGLETIQGILERLGNPQNSYAGIHIAGTNGKGSVAAALAAVLQAAGYRVGLYTSPHLVRFNERIRIDGIDISDEGVVRAYQAVKQAQGGEREPTFFEFATAMALHEFHQRQVDWAVIETGMGGRLDATNIIHPVLSILTNISLEHREYLGNTLAEIAREKAGIIKNHTPVVTGIRGKQALAVIREVAAERLAPVYRQGEEFRVRRSRSGAFSYFGIGHRWHHLTPPLAGEHQVDNMALVLAACEILIQKGTRLNLDQISAGLAATRWPGRLEIVSTSPLIILDGAHNLMAARYLARYLAEHLSQRDITLVVGILSDKPYAAMLHSLLPVCRRAIITRPQIDRGLAPETLLAVAREITSLVTVIPEVGSAVKAAVESAGPDGVVCVAGSLYVVGEAKAALAKMEYQSE